MPRIEKVLIMPFNDKTTQINEVEVVQSAKFLEKVKILHDGIYGFYEMPSILSANDLVRKDKFYVMKPGDLTPDQGRLIDILDVIIEVNDGNQAEPTQGVMLFPVYKLN